MNCLRSECNSASHAQKLIAPPASAWGCAGKVTERVAEQCLDCALTLHHTNLPTWERTLLCSHTVWEWPDRLCASTGIASRTPSPATHRLQRAQIQCRAARAPAHSPCPSSQQQAHYSRYPLLSLSPCSTLARPRPLATGPAPAVRTGPAGTILWPAEFETANRDGHEKPLSASASDGQSPFFQHSHTRHSHTLRQRQPRYTQPHSVAREGIKSPCSSALSLHLFCFRQAAAASSFRHAKEWRVRSTCHSAA